MQRIIPDDQPTAQALLEAAETAGLPLTVVRSTTGAFIVPDEVADIFHRGGVKEAPKKKAAPRRSRKSAEKE